jgi:uncharacterized membrane protein YcaP (DUF421 family)
MKKEEIHLLDIKRWLIGQTTPEFMIEVCIRTVIIYLILLLTVKLMGKRMSGQISLTELAVMVTLGAIVSPVMQLPDRGIFFGVVVLLVALVFQRGLNWLAFKNEKVEHLSQGKMSLLIKDGTLVLEEMEKNHLTKQQVFSFLREKKITNLGKVKRGYMEACGIFSVYETSNEQPGLPVFPGTDPAIKNILKELPESIMACCNCGHVQKISGSNNACEICNADEWTKAYMPS